MFKFSGPLAQDWVSSLVVFIVALPLSLGIALASGASPAAGLITAVAGGIVAGALAGAPLSVTGPAAGLTAIVFQLVQQYGIAGLAIITFLCGLIQLVMGAVRAGRLFTLIPTPVLEGVLSAIGLIIVLGQMHVLVGAPIPKSPVQAALDLPASLSGAIGGEYLVAPVLLCGLLALAIQLLWPKVARHKLKLIPGALPAVILVTGLSVLWSMPRVELAPFLSTIQSSAGEFFTFGWLSSLGIYFLPAFGLAVVASAESLLTARAVDILIQQRPRFKPCNLNRELVAQGTANLTSGIIGGIPMTAVMVRSAANVNAGAHTRWSTILHGVWIAALVVIAPGLLMKIPLAALAAVLILIGVRLINFKHFAHTMRSHKNAGAVWLATTAAIFATDLLKGLAIGIGIHLVLNYEKVLAAMKTTLRARRFSAVKIRLATERRTAADVRRTMILVEDGGDYLLKFLKDVSRSHKPELQNHLLAVPKGHRVLIDGTGNIVIDPEIEKWLAELASMSELQGRHVEFVRSRLAISKLFKKKAG